MQWAIPILLVCGLCSPASAVRDGIADSPVSSQENMEMSLIDSTKIESKYAFASKESDVHSVIESKANEENYVILNVYSLIGNPFSGMKAKDLFSASAALSSSLSEMDAHSDELGNASSHVDSTSKLVYHSEVQFCPRNYVTTRLENFLPKEGSSFTEIPVEVWRSMNVGCSMTSFGGSERPEPTKCSGMYVRKSSPDMKLSSPDHGPYKGATKYLYGTSDYNGESAYKAMCDCNGENWAETSYSTLNRNCNTYSKTLMSCVLHLSASHPFFMFASSKMSADSCGVCR